MNELEEYRTKKYTELFSDINSENIKNLPQCYITAAFITGFNEGVEYANGRQRFNNKDMCDFAEYIMNRMTIWRYDNGKSIETTYDSEKVLKQFIEEQHGNV